MLKHFLFIFLFFAVTASFAQYLPAVKNNPAETNGFKEAIEKINSSTANTSKVKGGVKYIYASDYLYVGSGKPLGIGFYLVTGTFCYPENADKSRATSVQRGHLNTKIIQNKLTKIYYIYVLKTNNRADIDAERAKFKTEYQDAWILKLE